MLVFVLSLFHSLVLFPRSMLLLLLLLMREQYFPTLMLWVPMFMYIIIAGRSGSRSEQGVLGADSLLDLGLPRFNL